MDFIRDFVNIARIDEELEDCNEKSLIPIPEDDPFEDMNACEYDSITRNRFEKYFHVLLRTIFYLYAKSHAFIISYIAYVEDYCTTIYLLDS